MWFNTREPHLVLRKEPQGSSPFQTPISGFLQSWVLTPLAQSCMCVDTPVCVPKFHASLPRPAPRFSYPLVWGASATADTVSTRRWTIYRCPADDDISQSLLCLDIFWDDVLVDGVWPECGYVSLCISCHSILPTTQDVGAIVPSTQMR